MPRKRNEQIEQTDKYNKPFPTRLRDLMSKSKTTQEQLKNHLGKSNRQTISYYCDGTTAPDWETIASIADYFNVSADYLLGRRDDPSIQPCAVDDLGLSPAAIAKLNAHPEHCGIISALLSNETFWLAVNEINITKDLISYEINRLQEQYHSRSFKDAMFEELFVQDELMEVLSNYSKEKASRFKLVRKSEYIINLLTNAKTSVGAAFNDIVNAFEYLSLLNK